VAGVEAGLTEVVVVAMGVGAMVAKAGADAVRVRMISKRFNPA